MCRILMTIRMFLLAGLVPWLLGSCRERGPASGESMNAMNTQDVSIPSTPQAPKGVLGTQPLALPAGKEPGSSGSEVATFGAGCFWCVEAVLEMLDGVTDVTSGYMGGHVVKPTYQQVCTGITGHAEVVQVTYDPRRISYERLLDQFWKLHDPTTLNRQGNDVGPQYRSIVFYHGEAQREAAERSRKALQASGAFKGPIVTEIAKAGPFYKAEDYHQDYFRTHGDAPYCRHVIAPKLEKLGLGR